VSARSATVPALVLSCDRYHPFAAHMARCYHRLWPDHPFLFHVPYQRQLPRGPGVIPRRTPAPLRDTVLALLDGLADQAWVYFCIDDKYPIALDPRVGRLAAAVLGGALADLDGLLFCRCRGLLRPEHLLAERRDGPDGLVLLRRRDYSQIWIHQFLRAKVLRTLFEAFPRQLVGAKSMDALKDRMSLPADHRLYVVETNLAIFGESTTRGQVTRNCAASLRALGLALPPEFALSDREIVMGGPGLG
jgi:hypothetical protein